jgi:hypothetical protein
MRVIIFIEGKFRLTNQMLSDLRAAGHYEGEATLMRRQGKWKGKKKPGYDLFSAETQAIRLAVKAHAKGIDMFQGVLPVDVALWVVGHRKFDPDAWYLLGKATVDGLVDAGVLGSDRFGVGVVSGRVIQTEAEERWIRDYLDEVMGDSETEANPGPPRTVGRSGVYVLLESGADRQAMIPGREVGGHA